MTTLEYIKKVIEEDGKKDNLFSAVGWHKISDSDKRCLFTTCTTTAYNLGKVLGLTSPSFIYSGKLSDFSIVEKVIDMYDNSFIYLSVEQWHAGIIEKREDRWRVYESYADYYTLAEWLGIDRLFRGEDRFRKWGGGKWLNRTEILEYVQSFVIPDVSIHIFVYSGIWDGVDARTIS